MITEKELEARMLLAMQLNYANYAGYITHALQGKTIPEEVIRLTNQICSNEGYQATLSPKEGSP